MKAVARSGKLDHMPLITAPEICSFAKSKKLQPNSPGAQRFVRTILFQHRFDAVPTFPRSLSTRDRMMQRAAQVSKTPARSAMPSGAFR